MTRTRNRIERIVRGALMLSAALAVAGCQQGQPGAGPWQGLPAEQAEPVPAAVFFNRLATQSPQVNENLGYQAMLFWTDGKDESKHFGERIAALQAKGLADPKWVHDPAAPLTKGRLASMVCRKLKLRSSLALWLFGPNERAARRELIFREIMSDGGDWEPVSGMELVTVIKRAEDYEASRNAVASAPE